MCGKTTYSESYMENEAICMGKPILPPATYIFPYGAEFMNKTVYKESYLPGEAERVQPFVPFSSISIPDVRMSADTTSKVISSFLYVERKRLLMSRYDLHFIINKRYYVHYIAAELPTSLDRETETVRTVS